MSNQIHPYEPNKSAKSSAAVVPHASFSQAIEEFDRAWRDPQHTPIELEPLDVQRQVTAMSEVMRQFIAISVERELGRKLIRR